MRLVIVSNSLPIRAEETEKGKVVLLPSSGGLASGLSSYLRSLTTTTSISDYLWVGWPGHIEKDSALVSDYAAKNRLHPIFLEESKAELFYSGFCNNAIWPLFHYFLSYSFFNTDEWNSYREINETFANELSAIIREDDLIWIHDYHLMLLPQLLRSLNHRFSIGFFLHIPFPVFELFRILPRRCREQLLHGILGADVIGFHTYDYTRYFLDCVHRILGYNHTVGLIETEKRLVKVDTFPMGIEFSEFYEAPLKESVQSYAETLTPSIAGKRVILSVDRLDYTKGILKRLESYELLLNKHSELRELVVMIIVVVPSRTGVEQYQRMKQDIDEYVGKINGMYGSVSWTPAIYQYKSLSTDELSALYSVSDIALVTPLRDGMNLVAKEYVASRRDTGGVLILSEMAGAAEELGEAMMINPHHVDEIVEALERALHMPIEEQAIRMKNMQERLSKYPVQQWAQDFLSAVASTKTLQKEEEEGKMLTATHRAEIMKAFHAAQHRLLLLDYDGTLISFFPRPEEAKPDAQLIELLTNLAAHPNTDVVLVSGRDRMTLERWFDDLGIHCCAEHGIWIREPKEQWTTIKAFRCEWKESIRPILEHYTARLPGSFIEEKEFSLAWHYRLAPPSLARARSKELSNTLAHLISNLDVQILKGNRVIELRCSGADKGNVVLHYLHKKSYDFILAIGDDTTDEDLFRAVPESAYTIRVGRSTHSAANYFVSNHTDVRRLLEDCIKKESKED